MDGRRALRTAALIAAAALFTVQPSSSQAPIRQARPEARAPRAGKPGMRNLIPDKFTNLQVLPKDIAKPDLVQIMKGFSQTFDKRCNFCHVATDDLSKADFASDEKETKKKARRLLRSILAAEKQPASGR